MFVRMQNHNRVQIIPSSETSVIIKKYNESHCYFLFHLGFRYFVQHIIVCKNKLCKKRFPKLVSICNISVAVTDRKQSKGKGEVQFGHLFHLEAENKTILD